MTSKLTREQLHERARENVKALKMASRQTAFESAREEILADLQLAELALAAMDSEPVKRVNADQMHHVCLEANRHLDKYGAMAKEVNKLLGRIPAQPAPVAPVAPENCVTVEHRRVIEMLLNVCGAAFELADDSCQQDVDGEDCHVVPDDAFQKLSDALDEIENTLPTEDIDRPDVFLAWSAMPRAALKSLLQAGNSPVIPDRWIPVSERLPFDEIVSLPKPMGGPFLVAYSSGAVDISWYSCRQDITGRRGEWDGETGTLAIAMGRGKITHWMPRPAAPQEVNHG